MVSKWGVPTFVVNGATGQSNGNWPQAVITAINNSPTFEVNGVAVSANGPAWDDTAAASNAVHYLLQCGSVTSLPMSSVGSITGALSASWDGASGGGTSLVLGTVNTASGIPSYTINSAGSGLTNGVYDYSGWSIGSGFPGAPTGIPATASITVAGGIVTSVVPRSAAPHAIGGGYSGTSYSKTGIYPAGDSVGSAASITLNVGTYITGVTVTSSSADFTGPPTITITGATGAVCAPIMSGTNFHRRRHVFRSVRLALDQSRGNGISYERCHVELGGAARRPDS